jgi:hypothetical protein
MATEYPNWSPDSALDAFKYNCWITVPGTDCGRLEPGAGGLAGAAALLGRGVSAQIISAVASSRRKKRGEGRGVVMGEWGMRNEE